MYRAYDINTTAFGSDPQGTKVGEVSMVAKASWGGQLDILVIVYRFHHSTWTTMASASMDLDWLIAQDEASSPQSRLMFSSEPSAGEGSPMRCSGS